MVFESSNIYNCNLRRRHGRIRAQRVPSRSYVAARHVDFCLQATSCGFQCGQGNLRHPTKPALCTVVVTVVLQVSMRPVLAWSPCNVATKRRRAWFIRLNTHRRENCKLVIKAVIVANVHVEDAGSQRVGSHRRKESYSLGGAGRVLEGIGRLDKHYVG